MTLAQALALAQRNPDTSRRRKIFLACGFQPLHLIPLLKGHFAERFPNEDAEIHTGTYGDLAGTLEAAAETQAEAAAVVLEWADLDPRLGLRSAGGWAVSRQTEILENCSEQFGRLVTRLQALAAKMPVGLVPPTLPILFLGHTANTQSSVTELELQKQLAAFLAKAATISGVSVLKLSNPDASHLDAVMELRAGFPYTIAHASAVAGQLVKLLFPPSPKKGLITDLDETFWSGILGEIGVGGVSWSLAEHSQIHALYQQMLRHLSEMGALLAIASKNELTLVEEALRRDDILVPASSFFPVCANWGPKSQSIAEILRIWNVGADSVVFVDDSAMELEEVQTAFPAMTCLQFSKKQPAKVLALLEQLRDLFGKPTIQKEDGLRQSSIRANVEVQAAVGESGGEFIRGLHGTLTFDRSKDPSNKRLLELINKTNQFNLNGVRLSEGEWLKHLRDENAEVVGVSYEDKFGPLGTIGVLALRHLNDQLEVTSWVLSCRAFSRKIEHHMLDYLFNQCRVPAVRLAFRRTDRNQPLQTCLKAFDLSVDQDSEMLLLREQFQNRIEDLPHEVRLQKT
jgi:FkbH-like protein